MLEFTDPNAVGMSAKKAVIQNHIVQSLMLRSACFVTGLPYELAETQALKGRKKTPQAGLAALNFKTGPALRTQGSPWALPQASRLG